MGQHSHGRFGGLRRAAWPGNFSPHSCAATKRELKWKAFPLPPFLSVIIFYPYLVQAEELKIVAHLLAHHERLERLQREWTVGQALEHMLQNDCRQPASMITTGVQGQ